MTITRKIETGKIRNLFFFLFSRLPILHVNLKNKKIILNKIHDFVCPPGSPLDPACFWIGLRTVVSQVRVQRNSKNLPATMFLCITQKIKSEISEIWFFFLFNRFQIFHVNFEKKNGFWSGFDRSWILFKVKFFCFRFRWGIGNRLKKTRKMKIGKIWNFRFFWFLFFELWSF